jgi:serine/threonine-protein kinase
VKPISREWEILGTVPYMAPEQLRGEAVDALSDLFSLGIILYELATGRRPFIGQTSAEVMASILRDTPKPLSEARADLPADLERIILQCLEKNGRQRIQTARDVKNALLHLQKTLERGGLEAQPSDKVASIAVLPFVNRSHDEEDEYFSDGLADELLNMLAKIKGLRVTARSSAFTFKGKQVTASKIGRALNVATLLEGSFRKSGDRIRVSVQLVNVSDSSHLWSETYDRRLEDIFAVQDDIAQSVVKELRTTLLGEEAGSDANRAAKAEIAQAAKGRGTDPEAHRLYLLARHLIDRLTNQDVAKAIEYLKAALERDPEYALAWATLGWAYARRAGQDWDPVMEGYARARVAVERALALEPDLSEGHSALGWIQMLHDWNWTAAEASFARALKLSPGDPEVVRRMGLLASTLGRTDEAIEHVRRAAEQDPLSTAAHHTLGYELHSADRFVEAEQSYQKALELAPHRLRTHAMLSLTLLALGRDEAALAEAAREPDERFRLFALAIVHQALGHRIESDAAIREIERSSSSSHSHLAAVYGERGEADKAFEHLEQSYARRDPALTEVKSNPHFRSLHGDARWSAFLKKMGLES